MKKYLLPWYKAIFPFACLSGIIPGSSSFCKAFQADIRSDTLPENPDGIRQMFRPLKLNLLYGQQQRDRLVQSVGYLDGKRLESSPVTLLSNAFAGQLAGLNAIQSNGAPRYDSPALQLRGRSPLIIIDGIPRYNEVYDELSLNPEQIESVTLLKDGLSTVMLGNRAMDGVLMITTRKKSEKPGSYVSFTAQSGVQNAIGMRESLSAFNYASLYNEARVNSGMSPVYSPAQLEAYKNGTDAYLSPNVNWGKTVLRSNAPQSRYTLNAGGNYTNIRYFLSLDYQNQKGLFREDASNSYGTNIDYKRYIFRSNIEINVNKNLIANLYLIGNIQDYNQPGVGYQAILTSLATTPANASPVYNFRGTFAGTREYPRNPYAETVGTGYLRNNLQGLGVNVGLTQKTDKIIEGSWLKAVLSYSPSYEQRINRSKNYNAFYYPVTGDTASVLRVNTISEQPNSSAIQARSQQTYVELSAGLERHWNKNDFSALILASHNSNQFDNDLSDVYRNAAARLTYGFDRRFNVELAGAYSSNNRFAPGKQADFYPGAGASWNLHHEDFWKANKFFNELKLRVSYAKVGNADAGYYAWRQTYTSGSAYFFGTGATSTGSVSQGPIANPNRVTEKAKKLNAGFDLAFNNQRGWLSADYFNSSEYDLLQQRADSSALFGNNYPLENIGKNRYSGIEVNAGWASNVGKLGYSISGNISTVSSRVIFNDEPEQASSYLERTGQPVNQIRGYVAEGFYGPGDLNAPGIEGFQPSEGDVRYNDLNGDGVINALDQKIIGNAKPLLYFGADLRFQFAGFDLTILFQGVQNRDILTTGTYQFPFNNNGLGQAFAYHLDRYTPETAATATLPRVTIQNEVNNYLTSSLYVRNGSFIRLKNSELGYSFPEKVISKLRIKGLRLFVNGQNLLTFSKYKDSDPENYTGLYPIQRVLNGGLSVKF